MLSIAWKILIIIIGLLTMVGKCYEGYLLNKYLINGSKKEEEKENILQIERSIKNFYSMNH